MNETLEAAKRIGQGIAWAGFWIGLGLYNFQGKACNDEAKTLHDLSTEHQSK